MAFMLAFLSRHYSCLFFINPRPYVIPFFPMNLLSCTFNSLQERFYYFRPTCKFVNQLIQISSRQLKYLSAKFYDLIERQS